MTPSSVYVIVRINNLSTEDTTVAAFTDEAEADKWCEKLNDATSDWDYFSVEWLGVDMPDLVNDILEHEEGEK